MHSRQRTILGLVLFVPVAAVLVTMFACLPAPVGDPEKSTVDDKLTGAWMAVSDKEEERVVVLLRPWDKHTYYLVYLTPKKAAEKVTHMHFKAWLTKLGDATFFTAETLDSLDYAVAPAPDEKNEKVWIVGRVEAKDGKMQFRMVNEKSWIVKDLKTRDKLEEAIKAQVDNKELYGDPLTFERVSGDKMKAVQDLLKENGFPN